MTAPFVYHGAMNSNVFLAYVEQILVPSLSAGDIVVMNNLPPTRSPVFAMPLRRPKHDCFTCRHTVPER